MSLTNLECALIAQIAYQSPQYVESAWKIAHGIRQDSENLRSDLLDTQLPYIDSRHTEILKSVPNTPEFSDDHTTDADCYVFEFQRGEESPVLVIAYRGTSSLQDCFCDVDLALRKFSGEKEKEPLDFSGAMVHCGFLDQFNALRHFTDLRVGNWDKNVVCIGHSLGSIATIAALVYSSKNRTYLRTFGSPRIGNDVFVKLVSDRVTDIIRTVARSDPIPKVPLPMGYRHAGRELHIGKLDNHPYVPLMTDIKDHDLGKSYIPLLTNPECIVPSMYEYTIDFIINKLILLKFWSPREALKRMLPFM